MQQMKIAQHASQQTKFHHPTIPPKSLKPPPRRGNIVLVIPNTPAGGMALEHLAHSADKDLGCTYVGTLTDVLRDYGVVNATYASDLKYIFVVLETQEGDEISAINRILRFHCFHGKLTWPHGDVEGAEINSTLTLYKQPANTIGLPFVLRSPLSMHDTYLQLLKVNNAYQQSVRGQSINVSVVDSGSDGIVSAQFLDIYDVNNSTPVDHVGHGTAMASIIKDIAPDAVVSAIRIADTSPSLIATMAGVCKALYDQHADIINLSLGFSSLNSRCQACGKSADARSYVFEKLLWANVNLDPQTPFRAPLFVTATGNDGNSTFNQPASYETGFAVGAISSHMTRSSFSNYGNQHNHFLVMPGGDYDQGKQTNVEWSGEGPNNKCLGTSAAAAYASGMLALYKSDPRHKTQSRSKFMDAMINNCQQLPSHSLAEHGSGYLPFK
jgi:hypothetical protein